MRLNYLDFQIVYLEDTGDVSVYKDNKEIFHSLNFSRRPSTLYIFNTLSRGVSK